MRSGACIFCCRPLPDGEGSRAHLVPKALGGQLASTGIECLACNHLLSLGPESSLIQCYSTFGAVIGAVREDGSPVAATKVEALGREFLLQGASLTLRRSRGPRITRQDGAVEVEVHRRDLHGLAREIVASLRAQGKSPADLRSRSGIWLEPLQVEAVQLGEFPLKPWDPKLWPSMIKIALEFLTLVTPEHAERVAHGPLVAAALGKGEVHPGVVVPYVVSARPLLRGSDVPAFAHSIEIGTVEFAGKHRVMCVVTIFGFFSHLVDLLVDAPAAFSAWHFVDPLVVKSGRRGGSLLGLELQGTRELAGASFYELMSRRCQAAEAAKDQRLTALRATKPPPGSLIRGDQSELFDLVERIFNEGLATK